MGIDIINKKVQRERRKKPQGRERCASWFLLLFFSHLISTYFFPSWLKSDLPGLLDVQWKELWLLWSQRSCVQILPLPLSIFVTLGKSLPFPGPWFLHLGNEWVQLNDLWNPFCLNSWSWIFRSPPVPSGPSTICDASLFPHLRR